MKRHRDYRLLVVLLTSFVVPILMAFLLVWVGIGLGCEVSGEAAPSCMAAGIDLGVEIAHLLDLTWQFPLLLFFPFGWIVSVGLVLTVIHRQLRGCLRLALALVSIGYVPLAPTVLGFLFVSRLSALGNCTINASGRSVCYVFGVDMGDQFAQAMVVPWLGLTVLPVGIVIALLYLGLFLLPWRARQKA
jgi:hypothetical protein